MSGRPDPPTSNGNPPDNPPPPEPPEQEEPSSIFDDVDPNPLTCDKHPDTEIIFFEHGSTACPRCIDEEMAQLLQEQNEDEDGTIPPVGEAENPPHVDEAGSPQPPTPSRPPPPRRVNPDRPNVSVLALVREWAELESLSGKWTEVMGMLMTIHGAKIADDYNYIHSVHRGPDGNAFRYLTHTVLVGPAASGKGILTQRFLSLIRTHYNGELWHLPGHQDQTLWPVATKVPQSIEAMRGGFNSEREFTGSAISDANGGYLPVPEFYSILGRVKKTPGALNDILEWMTSRRMSFRLVGGDAEYESSATVLANIQERLLADIETASETSGLARRLIHLFLPHLTSAELRTLYQQRPATPAINLKVREIQDALLRLYDEWHPDSIDWSDVTNWLVPYINRREITLEDISHVHALAVGQYMMSGGPRRGRLTIRMTPGIEFFIRFMLRNKTKLMTAPSDRMLDSAMELLSDPDIMGDGQRLTAYELREYLGRGMKMRRAEANSLRDKLVGLGGIIEVRLDSYQRPRYVLNPRLSRQSIFDIGDRE